MHSDILHNGTLTFVTLAHLVRRLCPAAWYLHCLLLLQISIAYMQMLGAERPWETMLAACLWLAAKLEECRRSVPTASKVGLLLGVRKSVMGEVELYLMQLLSWAPLRGWQAKEA